MNQPPSVLSRSDSLMSNIPSALGPRTYSQRGDDPNDEFEALSSASSLRTTLSRSHNQDQQQREIIQRLSFSSVHSGNNPSEDQVRAADDKNSVFNQHMLSTICAIQLTALSLPKLTFNNISASALAWTRLLLAPNLNINCLTELCGSKRDNRAWRILPSAAWSWGAKIEFVAARYIIEKIEHKVTFDDLLRQLGWFEYAGGITEELDMKTLEPLFVLNDGLCPDPDNLEMVRHHSDTVSCFFCTSMPGRDTFTVFLGWTTTAIQVLPSSDDKSPSISAYPRLNDQDSLEWRSQSELNHIKAVTNLLKNGICRTLQHVLSAEDCGQTKLSVSCMYSGNPLYFPCHIFYNEVKAHENSLLIKVRDRVWDESPLHKSFEHWAKTIYFPTKHRALGLVKGRRYSNTSTDEYKRIQEMMSAEFSSNGSLRSLPTNITEEGLEKRFLMVILDKIKACIMTKDDAKNCIYQLSEKAETKMITPLIPKWFKKLDDFGDSLTQVTTRQELINSKKFPLRRRVLADFLTNFQVRGQDHMREIQDMLNDSRIAGYEKPVDKYLLLSLGVNFVDTLQDDILVYDETTADSKMKGKLIRGDSDTGKSFFMNLLYGIFDVLRLSWDAKSVDVGDVNNSTTNLRFYDYHPHIILLDEHQLKAKLPNRSKFNNLFDWNTRPCCFKSMYATSRIYTKAPIVLITHDHIPRDIDPSFMTRWNVVIDLNEPVFVDQTFQREEGETAEAAYKRGKASGSIEDKIAFPISVKKVGNKCLTEGVGEDKIHKHMYEQCGLPQPGVSEIQKTFTSTRTHREILAAHPFTKDLLAQGLPELTPIQATYFVWTRIVRMWQMRWNLSTDSKREQIIPLTSGRAELLENLINAPQEKYTHQHDKVKKISLLEWLSHPDLLEHPQALCHAILSSKV